MVFRLIFTALLLSCPRSFAFESSFISDQDWQKLNLKQKKSYLLSLQEIMAEMSVRGDLFAKQGLKARNPANSGDPEGPSFFAKKNLLQAKAEFDEASVLLKAGDFDRAAAALKRGYQLLGKSRLNMAGISNSEERDKIKFDLWNPTERQAQVVESELKRKLPGQARALDQERERVRSLDNKLNNPRLQQRLLNDPFVEDPQLRREFSHFFTDLPSTALTSVATNPAPKTEAPAPAKSQDVPAPNPKEVVSQSQNPDVSRSQTSAQSAEEFFHCMYAGFVIKTAPCQAPTSLPEEMPLKNVRLSCQAPQILCNPLLFGARSSCSKEDLQTPAKQAFCLESLQGLCTSVSPSATLDCKELASRDEKNLDMALLLIDANFETWQKYLKSFDLLCDQEKIDFNQHAQKKGTQERVDKDWALQDIRRTCQWALDQLQKLKERFTLPTHSPKANKERAIESLKKARIKGTH